MSLTPYEFSTVPRLRKLQVINSLRKGARIDGRGFEDYRKITIELGTIPKAAGSALVRIGDTTVLVGVKTEIGEPYRDRPLEGVLQVHAEFVPLASPTFEPGPPDENAIETARVIDRSLREPRAIKLEELTIVPGRKVWIVFNDIYLLDHNGNIVDTSMLATMAALRTARLPRVVSVEGDTVIIDKSTREKPLPVQLSVVIVSVAKINGYLLVDPNIDEESVLDAKLMIGVDEKGRIVGMQKTGQRSFTRSEVDQAIELALKKAGELHTFLNQALAGR